MASEFSFDIVSQFDLQEVRNAVDQVKREIATRYDFRGSNATVELGDDLITVIAASEMQVGQVWDVLLQKIINRKQSPKILDKGEIKPIGGMQFKLEVKLVKALTQDKCKKISAMIKDGGFKVKHSIQGEAVRVSGKDKDELQAVMNFLRGKEEEVGATLTFQNYR
jgi:uncharacterized protein YajQ (UPF0234 family)